jgi:hypothetical protein
MSDSLQSSRQAQSPAQEALDGETATAAALPVLAVKSPQTSSGRPLGRLSGPRSGGSGAMPAVQAAAVAAGGFVAGAAVVGLVHRRGRRSAALAGSRNAARSLGRAGARRAAQAPQALQVLSSHKLLVDVHVLGTPGPGH